MYFTCEYCGKKLQSEKAMEKHFCEAKKRYLLLKSKVGRSAFFYYSVWRKKKGFKVVDETTFLNSKFFKSFINFLEFCKDKMIPEREGFIELMVKKDVSPLHWCNNFYHEYYMEKFDELYSPMKQVSMSLDYLDKLTNALECELETVITEIHPIELIQMVLTRKLSPWLLFFSRSFAKHVNSFDNEQKILINSIMSPTVWKNRLTKEKAAVLKIKEITKQLEI